MNNAKQVDSLVAGWIQEGLSKSEIIWKAALAEIDWDYVWGATGQKCMPSTRTTLRNRQIQKGYDGEAAETKRKCQVMNGKKSSCDGCKFFPDGERTLIDDCQGFVKQICKRVGITFTGGGCTSMWAAKANWSEQGPIANMPKDRLCCVFWSNGSKKSHIGFSWNGELIHCSGCVKHESLSKKCTDYAIPKGLEDDPPEPTPLPPVPPPETRPTLRKGDKGDYVKLAQIELINAGYSCGKSGADGIFGDNTLAAVKNFQKDPSHKDPDGKPLVQDGIVGRRTWYALDQAQPAEGSGK